MAVLGTLGITVSFGQHFSLKIELNDEFSASSWATVLVLLVNLVSWVIVLSILLFLRVSLAQK